MSKKQSTTYIDYQARAAQVSPGDMAFPFSGTNNQAGRVVAVFPAIGMVDVEYPSGVTRFPVEDLQFIDSADFWINAPLTNSVPGGKQVPVSGGPHNHPDPKKHMDKQREMEERITALEQAEENLKKKEALYWAGRDRKYKATRSELVSGSYQCPRCKQGVLKKCVYKRQGGLSEKLYGCPQCLFLIKRCDVKGCED